MSAVLLDNTELIQPLVPQMGFMRHVLLEQEVELLLQDMDREMTAEYHEALDIVPALVKKECNIMDFLRTEDLNAQRAAERIARFWKLRKLIFKDRWLFPLTQTGTGALSPDQVEILRSGYCSVHESEAGVVWHQNYSNLPVNSTRLQPQVIFYIGAVTTSIAAQTKGVTLLLVADSGKQPPPFYDPELANAVMGSIPVKITAFYIAHAFETGKEHLVDYVAFTYQKLCEANAGFSPEHIKSDSLTGTLGALEAKGLDRFLTPRTLGGSVGRNNFDDWIRRRMSVEDIMGGAPVIGNKLKLTYLLDSSQSDNNNTSIIKSNNKVMVLRKQGESAKEFAKRQNNVYCRRSYYRKKLAQKALQEEANKLQTQNTRLAADNIRLAALVAEATKLVEDAVTVDPLAHFYCAGLD